ncbi:hypothetical protein GCM10027019_13990 [Melaminivora jejuensis]|uniref:bifunctional diguanylate cyclase/phosphodiesterase n=1 Tax=Melaminivora jejuensis TaxID=1267217 RepID=UPI001ADED9C9|nr:EAL domain-containing protein [Melaminivora jejuensis]UHJ65934.1 EAL domain-containing protein [Melaminivora jejuensis]
MRSALHLHGRRLYLAIWVLVGLLIAGLAGSVLVLLYKQRSADLADSRAGVARLARGAEVGMNRTLLAVDVLLATFEELLGEPRPAGQSLYEQARAPALAAVARQNLMLRHVMLLDDAGRPIVAFDEPGGAAPSGLPAPEFVRQALAQALPGLLLGNPVPGADGVQQVLPVARPLRLPDGRRLLATAQIPVEALAAVLMQGLAPSQVELTLERSTGELLIGLDPERGLDERSHVQEGLALQDAPGAPASAPQGYTRLRARPGLVSARALMYDGLWVTASLPRTAALADWAALARLSTAATLLLIASLVLAGALATLHTRQMDLARGALARSKALLDQALGVMVSGFVLLDRDGLLVQWNTRFEEFFPWLAPLLEPGLPFRRLLQATVHYHLPGASAEAKAAWVEERLRHQQAADSPLEQHLPTGRIVQITERPTPDGGVVILYHDVTELHQAAADVEHLAFYDPLTGLANRRLLLQRIEQAGADALRTGLHGAVLFIDLDRFKTLNDTLGHEVGDLLLGQVARRLQGAVRAGDVVARLGGDEFVIVLLRLDRHPDTAQAQARGVAEKVLASLNQPYALDGHVHHSSASIGAALFGQEPQTATDVLKQADIAMYEAKSEHGNAVCFFAPSMQQALSERAQLVADLKQALPEDQLRLYLQPQFDGAGRVVGAEVLLRWQHPQRGLVGPAQFIAVAEESELIVPIGRWVLATACALLGRWQREPQLRELCLSVNVSARQFRQDDFVPMVMGCMAEAGVRPHLLELELTESLVLENVAESIDKMHQLRTRGVRFVVDDFGTGYSSLAYLTRLPLHRLKIDRSFVQYLGERHSDEVVVQTILGMARNLELDVVAEGVETQQQHDFLAAHGCTTYQGFLLARPMPVEQFEVLVRQGAAAP